MEQPIHVARGLFLRALEDVRVDAKRGAHVGVAEHLRDDLHRHAFGQQRRGEVCGKIAARLICVHGTP